MVKIYGFSDDLVCLDNSNYGVDEIGCFDVKGVRLFLDDDTILVVALYERYLAHRNRAKGYCTISA